MGILVFNAWMVLKNRSSPIKVASYALVHAKSGCFLLMKMTDRNNARNAKQIVRSVFKPLQIV